MLAGLLSIGFAYFVFVPAHETLANSNLQGRLLLSLVDCALISFFCTKIESMRTKSQNDLRQSQNFLETVIENIPNMIFIKDAKELRFVRMNRAGEKLTGASNKDLVGKTDFDLVPENQARTFQEKDRQVLAGDSIVEIQEEPLSTPTGIRYLSTKKIPLFGKDGNPEYLLGISEDITEKKQAEQQRLSLIQAQAAKEEAEKTSKRFALLESASSALNETLEISSMLQSFSQVIVESMADWCSIDLVDDRSKQFIRAAGYCKDPEKALQIQNFRNKYPLNIHSPYGAGEVFRTGHAELFSHLEDVYGKTTIPDELRKDLQALKFCSSIVVPLKHQSQKFGVMTLTNCNPNNRYNEIDLSVAEDLARKASVAIANAKLYAQAQEASRAKSFFLANMSHEIRTPLGAILGFTDLALDPDTKPNDIKTFLETIARNGKELLRIVDEVLDLSKVESGMIQVEKIPFNPKTVINDVFHLLKETASKKNLNLQLHYETELPKQVISDPTRFRQILLNVLGNAIKFTSLGHVSVHAAYTSPYLEVEVRDTGIGISPEQQSRLFQPFVQADNTTTRKFGGTGLGLSLSKKLSQLLGGDLSLLSSQYGAGSVFEVRIEAPSFTSTTEQVLNKRPSEVSM